MMDGFRCKILLLMSLIIIVIIIFQKIFIFIQLHSWFGLVCCVYPPSVFWFERRIFSFSFIWKYDFDTYQQIFFEKNGSY